MQIVPFINSACSPKKNLTQAFTCTSIIVQPCHRHMNICTCGMFVGTAHSVGIAASSASCEHVALIEYDSRNYAPTHSLAGMRTVLGDVALALRTVEDAGQDMLSEQAARNAWVYGCLVLRRTATPSRWLVIVLVLRAGARHTFNVYDHNRIRRARCGRLRATRPLPDWPYLRRTHTHTHMTRRRWFADIVDDTQRWNVAATTSTGRWLEQY